MKDLFFTRGEFAKFCKTTKETLRHYDNIGLLKPDKVGENGYYYYSARQLLKFTLITTLKSTGCSLQEINQYISNPEKANFKKLLTSQLQELLIEKRNIEKRESIIKNSIKRYEVLNSGYEINKFYVKEEEEEYFLITKVENNLSDLDWNKAISEHFNFCNNNDISMEYQISYISFLNMDNETETCYVANKIPYRIESEKLYVKPKGKYIKMIHIGKYEPKKIYSEAKKYAEENKMKIKGVSYESEVSIYMGDNIENYILEISIEIE